jgi:hypothetical protein
MARVDEDELQLITTISRQIWLRRNSVVFGGEMMGPAAIFQRAKEQVEMWCQANRREPNLEVIPRYPLIVEWTKSPLGRIKLNWDASIDQV